jgi:hypothetical protein
MNDSRPRDSKPTNFKPADSWPADSDSKDTRPGPRGRGRSSRISVSLHESLFRQLEELAQEEGRSLSNLCARLIETALEDHRQAS